MLVYTSVDSDLLSFRANSDAIVYMKSAGTNPDLWFVSIGGKTGFVNKKFLRETKILEKNLMIVPFEAKKEDVKPDKVQHAHEVFEGTTIYTTEAAVNEAQQDTSTESPLTSSNEDLTPALDNAEEIPNENVDEKKLSDKNVDLEPQKNEEPTTIATPDTVTQTEVPSISTATPSESTVQTEVPSTTTATPLETDVDTDASSMTSDVNESEEPSSDTIPETAEQLAQKNPEQNQLLEAEPNNEEVPSEIPTDTIPPQKLLPTVNHGSFNRESIIEVPDKQDYLQNTLTEPEQGDNKEQNTSSLNNNLDNSQVPEETSSESNNMPNGNSLNNPVNPVEELVENPTVDHDVTYPTTAPAITETAASPPNEAVVPPGNEPIVNQINQEIPPVYINMNPENQHNSLPPVKNLEPNENTAPTGEHMASASMEIPQTVEHVPAPSTETLLPVSSEAELPTATETLLPVYSEEPHTVPIPETIPPIMNMDTPSTTEIPPPELPQYEYITTPAPSTPDESYKTEESSEPPPTEDTPTYPQAPVEEIIAALPDSKEDINTASEASGQDENTEGFFSNIYTTVADIWPSSTESPESLYNKEYPTYESEKADGNDGFSFLKYFMSTYYSIMGTSEESKALFASVGKLKQFYYKIILFIHFQYHTMKRIPDSHQPRWFLNNLSNINSSL